jgi:hypothetical protein
MTTRGDTLLLGVVTTPANGGSTVFRYLEIDSTAL